jgi:hypothetical protein
MFILKVFEHASTSMKMIRADIVISNKILVREIRKFRMIFEELKILKNY